MWERFVSKEGETITVDAQSALWVVGNKPLYERSQLIRSMMAEFSEALLMSGVFVHDPNRLDIRGRLVVCKGTEIDVNNVFEGLVELGRVKIGANCVIKNSRIDDDVTIEPFCHIDGAQLSSRSVIGPYARLRPGSVLKQKAKVGNFCEIKKSHIGEGSKINHLSYIGDAIVGSGVNVGAGVITCNYDGVNKHKTEIADGAFIGTNASLVAPVVIGKHAKVAAGSTVTQDVMVGEVAFGRARQVNKIIKK